MPTNSNPPNPFVDFLEQIKNLSVGIARFYRVDFHVHSPESHDFPTVRNNPGYATNIPAEDSVSLIEEKKRGFESKIIGLAKQKKIDAIAITDHHKSRFAVDISSRINILTIFPGVEITATTSELTDGKVHLLALFAQGKPIEEIESIIPAANRLPTYDQRNHDTFYNGDLRELIRNIHSLGGIVIAAHVNSNRGLRSTLLEYNVARLRLITEVQVLAKKQHRNEQEEERFTQLQNQLDAVEDEAQRKYLKFLASSGVDAVQISKPTESNHYAEQSVAIIGLNPFPCLLASDAHNSGDIALANHCSYIKVTSLDIEGIKKAFKDPGARIRYEAGQRMETSKIRALKIEGGFFAGLTVVFSENLSCLIGGRGSGKSALIDAVRYLFSIACPDDATKKDTQNRQKTTLKGSTITALFEDASGNQFFTRKQYVTDGQSPLECFQHDGAPRAEIRDGSSKFAIELYGWSEIELLSRNIKDQRGLLDRANPANRVLIQDLAGLRAQLQQNRSSIVGFAEEYNRLFPYTKDLDEKSVELKSLRAVRKNTLKKHEGKISKYEKHIEKLEGQEDASEQLKQQFENTLNELDELTINSIEMENFSVLGKSAKKAVSDSQKFVKQAIRSSMSHIQKIIHLIGKDIEGIQSTRLAKQAELDELKNDPEYMEHRDVLQRSSSLRAEIRSLQSSIRQFRTTERNLKAALEARKATHHQIDEKRTVLLRNRESVIQKVNTVVGQINQKLQPRNIEIKIGIEKGKDISSFIQNLDAALTGIGAWYKANHYAEKIANTLSPKEFAEIVWVNNFTKLAAQCGFEEERAKSIIKHLKQMADDDELFNTENLGQLLELEECVNGDLPKITYNGKSVLEGLSPGQRCTALLPIIFISSANVPLIIDQPEDNLDSQLVFELVVDILRSLKEKRQVIIATHNANIPVSGDAEQVIVLEAESNTHTLVRAQASVDDAVIIKSVKELLEGGEDAFKIRGRKYGVIS